MELYELTNALKELFKIDDVSSLGPALYEAATKNDVATMDSFVELVDGDLATDWLQKVYQYNLANRDELKQDYTPKCLAEFLSLLVGDASEVVDLCAGSGALTIQRWAQYPDQRFVLYEIDDGVLPFLLFNLAVRNIRSTVYFGDALTEEYTTIYETTKGSKYAAVSRQQSAV